MKFKIPAAFLLLLMVYIGCKKEDKGSPGTNEMWLEYKAYNPSQLQVDSGTTVTFINKDNADHSVTSNSGIFSSGKIKSGNSYTYTFNTKGNFYFYCDYHNSNSSEQGVIVVK